MITDKQFVITSFIKKYSVPLVGELTSENERKRYNDKRPLCLVFYDVDWSFDHRDGKNCMLHTNYIIVNDFVTLTYIFMIKISILDFVATEYSCFT